MAKLTNMQKITDTEFAEIVKTSFSNKEVGVRCGYSEHSGAVNKIVKDRIDRQQLDTSHFSRSTPITRSDEEIFVEDSPIDQSTLRRRYKNGKYSEYKCAICGQEPYWNGKELTLTLDHINGHNRDNRLENLRWVCPNCDRQLDTFAGRNIPKLHGEQKEKQINYCIDCGKEISLKATRCPECANIFKGQQRRKVERPSREELKSKIRCQSFLQIGKEYGVSDNAIRKWCDSYGLPRQKYIISSYSDTQWEEV